MSVVGQRHREVDTARFSMVPRADIPRSTFRTQSSHKTTFNAAKLIPVFVDEVLPGDTHKVRATFFARLATTVHPIMDNLTLEDFWFFVPNRLIWEHWEEFMGQEEGVGASIDYLVPQWQSPAGGWDECTLADYLGIPVKGQITAGGILSVNALPARAYTKIFWDWFRDENLSGIVTPPIVTDGPDGFGVHLLRSVSKKHDYFTSALPWPAKPIAPIGAGTASFLFGRPDLGAAVSGIGLLAAAGAGAGVSTIYTGGITTTPAANQYVGNDVRIEKGPDGFPNIRVTIEALREAAMVRNLMELNARGGTRYTEILRAHFGVTSPDFRLMRSEFLGSGKTPVQVGPVAQTSETGTTALGDMAGVGTAVGGGGFSQSFTEHGILLGLVAVRSELTYQQGLDRMYSRRGKYDYYWPALAGLPEQPVYRREIYCIGSGGPDSTVFGYQERWSEYKHFPSRLSGRFRSTTASTLDSWHLGQRFTSAPVLNNLFIEDAPPMSRVLAGGATATNLSQEFLLDSYFEIERTRAMPVFNVPGMGARL